ncbi:MAG: hypothetical protein P4M13_05770 [Alphaproteobacteria bacterium]|nr:hypothetical protein [Alphaproteobacteria bacterium]
MRQEQDCEMAQRLADYRVADADEALLDRIVAAACATPQNPPRSFSLRIWVQSWTADAAALVAVALLGFWIGTHSFPAATTKTAAAREASSVGENYFDRIIFGPQSWKEINL